MGFLLVSKILKFLELQHVTLILMDLLKLFLQNMKKEITKIKFLAA